MLGTWGCVRTLGKERHRTGTWRAGVDGGEEEGDFLVHIALEMWIFVSWQLQEKPCLLTFTQGLALRRPLYPGVQVC